MIFSYSIDVCKNEQQYFISINYKQTDKHCKFLLHEYNFKRKKRQLYKIYYEHSCLCLYKVRLVNQIVNSLPSVSDSDVNC